MRQAIITKFHGPTNTKGDRIKASAAAGYIWHEWNWELNQEGNHRQAMVKLVEKLGWQGEWIGGGMPDGNSCCWIMLEG